MPLWDKLKFWRKQVSQATPRTSKYSPNPIDVWGIAPRDLPPFTFLMIRSMLWDPTIRLGLAMRAAPLHNAEFAYKEGETWTPGVRSKNPKVAEWVLRQLQFVWKSDLRNLLKSQVWGWAGGELMWRFNHEEQQIDISGILTRHASDVRALERDGQICGVRFRRVPQATAGIVDLPFPKAIWHSFFAEDGSHYGTSVLRGAYSPWADKWFDGGALDVRRLFMHKDAYGGMDIAYPPGSIEVSNPNGSGQMSIPNSDVARQMVEQAKAGQVISRPSQYDQHGNELWKVSHATVPPNPAHILQFPKDLDVEELRGMEIPDEVLISQLTGSWNGKAIPVMAFFMGLDSWLHLMIGDLVHQALEPGVLLNFGKAYDFEVCTKPLAEQASEQQNAEKGQGEEAPSSGLPNRYGPEYDWRRTRRNNQAVAMGLDRQQVAAAIVGEGVLGAAKLVRAARRKLDQRLNENGRMRMATKAKEGHGLRWITIGGHRDSDKEHAGGTRVLIDGDGNIHAGPKAIEGKNLRDLGDDREEASFDPDEFETPREPLEPTNAFHREVLSVAEDYRVDPHELKETAEYVWQETREILIERETAKTAARQRTGLTQRDIDRLSNAGFDHTIGSKIGGITGEKLRHFDALSQELAREIPELGLGDPDDSSTDFAAALWQALAEGKQGPPPKHDRDVIRKAAELLRSGHRDVVLTVAEATRFSLRGRAIRMAIRHAPKGGITIGGQNFAGGQFIPDEVMAKATAKEKAELEAGHAEDDEFSLANDGPKRKPAQFENKGGKQKALLAGVDSLPGQRDLFQTDGEESDATPATKSKNWKSAKSPQDIADLGMLSPAQLQQWLSGKHGSAWVQSQPDPVKAVYNLAGLHQYATQQEMRKGDKSPTASGKRGTDGGNGASTTVSSPAFKKWFGESKVVDDKGEPLVVYHGTADLFGEFSKDKVKSNFSYSFGFHFTKSPDEASTYSQFVDEGKDHGANVMPVYLSMQNPLILESGDQGPSTRIDLDRAEIIYQIVQSRKTDKPYDGVIVTNNEGNSNYVVFDPHQIKSASGNRGTFDGTSNDLRMGLSNVPDNSGDDNRVRTKRRKVKNRSPQKK